MMEEESDERLEELNEFTEATEEKGDSVTRVGGHLSVRWKDKRDVYAHSSIGWQLPRRNWPCCQTPCSWGLQWALWINLTGW
jgi:hypothetical protein